MSKAPPPPGGNQKRVFIKSFGCQMNVYDAERMADVLAPEGYQTVDEAEQADLVILNTCNIRERAADKIYHALGRIREMKAARLAKGGPDLRVAVAGCVAQAEGAEIQRREPLVDVVVGPQAYHRLPELLKAKRAVDTEFPLEDKFDHLPMADKKVIQARGVSAFLTVQEGCDKFCTFCVVPYTRGAEVSRPVNRIVKEAEALAEAGVREIMLLGQNVNAWHGVGDLGAGEDGKPWTLAGLIQRLAKVPGLERIRYSTSHPRDMDDALIAMHRDLPQAMPYLHLPVQSGSDRILKAMNRKHTAAHYRSLIDKVRMMRPDIALTSDFIVGFPGETDADFEATMQLICDVRFAAAYSFKYSQRPGTPAADKRGQVPEDIKTERLARLQALIAEQMRDFNTATIGRVLDVLIEKPGRNPGQIGGKTPYLQAIHMDGPTSLIGQIVRVEVTGISTYSLAGRLV